VKTGEKFDIDISSLGLGLGLGLEAQVLDNITGDLVVVVALGWPYSK